MRRKPDGWELRLDRYVTGLLRAQFQWGATDCAAIVAGGMRAVYLQECPVPAVRYRTLRGAYRFFRRMDTGVAGYLAHQGAVRIDRAFAQGGDVVVFQAPDDVGLPRLGLMSDASMMVTSHATMGVMALKLHASALPLTCWRF